MIEEQFLKFYFSPVDPRGHQVNNLKYLELQMP